MKMTIVLSKLQSNGFVHFDSAGSNSYDTETMILKNGSQQITIFEDEDEVSFTCSNAIEKTTKSYSKNHDSQEVVDDCLLFFEENSSVHYGYSYHSVTFKSEDEAEIVISAGSKPFMSNGMMMQHDALNLQSYTTHNPNFVRVLRVLYAYYNIKYYNGTLGFPENCRISIPCDEKYPHWRTSDAEKLVIKAISKHLIDLLA
ncbi:MAG: hypothetical protein ACRCXZ_08080 [Patescibacteria group bacterium]